jgi:hypothetical protein
VMTLSFLLWLVLRSAQDDGLGESESKVRSGCGKP